MDSLGGELQKVSNAVKPIKRKIGDIAGAFDSGRITEAEKISQIAALYNSNEYDELVNALSGATNSFTGNTSYNLNSDSIFNAAYKLQCENAMFSSEVINGVTPYLSRQLAKGRDNVKLNKILGTMYLKDCSVDTVKEMLPKTALTDSQFNELHITYGIKKGLLPSMI